MNKKESYLFGLIQTDGSVKKNRVDLELSIKDKDILLNIKEKFSIMSYISQRDRITNFGESHTSTLHINDKNYVNSIISFGMPCGSKSNIVEPPKCNFSEKDYVRGLMDGDGSVGFLKKDKTPWASFTTKSDKIKDYFLNYLKKNIGIEKICNRNKRDTIYNITIRNEDAVNFVKKIYYKNCLSIKRKYNISSKIKLWIRPIELKKNYHYIGDVDLFIMTHKIKESIKKFNLSRGSITSRRFILRHNLIKRKIK